MCFVDIPSERKDEYNAVVSHPLQSYEWGEFRKKTGVKVIRRGYETNGMLVSGFQLTIHTIPHTPFTIGYFPKGDMPSKELLVEIKKIGLAEKCIFIQLEPNVVIKTNDTEINKTQLQKIYHLDLRQAAHPLFTKYTFVLDLTKTEEEILRSMSSKTRYNIRLAEKKGVRVLENDSEKAFKKYLDLTYETTTRQKFYAHTPTYHSLMWDTLKKKPDTSDTNTLTAHLLTATYTKKILVTWVVFSFHDTLYYPYGASSSEQRDVMASNSMMWEAIRFGKKRGLTKFDMWGALSQDPDTTDPWYGFHRFKAGYGPDHKEFIGSYDFVIHPLLYQVYKFTDKVRWLYLRLKK